MKTCVRLGAMVLVLSLVGLFAGCASQSSAYRRQAADDFEIVETSTKRTFSDREMAYLRAKAIEYLNREGQTGSGDYYLKINLAEEAGQPKDEWVVVRYSRFPEAEVRMVASYPSTSYPLYPRYSYDYSPFGWFGFNAFTFRYYDDPYYGYGSYYPSWTYPHYTGNWRHPDRRPDHRPDRDPPTTDGRPNGALKPSYVPSQGDRTRWSGNNRDNDNRGRDRGNQTSNNGGTRPNWRDRDNRSDAQNTGSTYSPSSNSGSNRPATRSDFHRDRSTSGDNSSNRGRDYSPPPSSQSSTATESRSYSPPAPSYTPPPSYSPPASSESSQPATRSVLHDGGRTAREP
ncbi:hypothetical protein ESB00_12045 [Oleiharenicola lentus]|uniref:DUF4136 domain-containing protein n=1 Tax=Oleiharenicola lentus TaxID=2508720 RepID=A0A4Q1CC85_9BACT|nr:hypothetical protein [Oleiharenicola lentus]RXK56561.1 hypothetical protein ESB00_12045 [Oleiharenicola lentus]